MKLKLMIRIYFLQQRFNLGDPMVEEAVYDRKIVLPSPKKALMNFEISTLDGFLKH